MTFPFGEAVVQHSRVRGASDSDGNETWTDADTTHTHTVVYPRGFSGTQSGELLQARDTVVMGLTLVFVPAVTVAAVDEFTVRGERWAVDGLPGQFDSPFTGKTLTQIHLTRAEG